MKGKIDIGLQLENLLSLPDLNIGITLIILARSGKLQHEKLLSIILVSG